MSDQVKTEIITSTNAKFLTGGTAIMPLLSNPSDILVGNLAFIKTVFGEYWEHAHVTVFEADPGSDVQGKWTGTKVWKTGANGGRLNLN